MRRVSTSLLPLVLACSAPAPQPAQPAPPAAVEEKVAPAAAADAREDDGAYRAGVAALCLAEVRSGHLGAPLADKMAGIEAWLEQAVTSPRARALIDEVWAAPERAPATLRHEAAAVGVEDCPFAAFIEWGADAAQQGSIDSEQCVQACVARNAAHGKALEIRHGCEGMCGAPVSETYAVVVPGARLYQSSGDPTGARIPAWPADAGRAVRALASADSEWVEVVPIVGIGHCASGLPGLASTYELRLRVRARDLQTVTTERVDLELGDGGKVSLAAGVPLRATRGGFIAEALPSIVPLRIPPDAVGTFYGMALLPEVAETHLVVPRATMTVGPHSLSVGERAWPGAASAAPGGRQWFQHGDDCVQVRGLVEATAVQPAPELVAGGGVGGVFGGMVGGVVGGVIQRYRVPAGAQVRWPDGSPAGTVRRSFVSARVAGQGDLWCRDVVVLGHEKLRLCVAAKDAQLVDQ